MSAYPLPRHVAIIMDGNGRWAKKRLMPRAEGHRRGVLALNRVVEHAARVGIERLTVFAFSSENWRRPGSEVKILMELFAQSLTRWVKPLKEAGVRLRVIGDLSAFSDKLREAIALCEKETGEGTRMELNIAANYGGQWDICQAAKKAQAAGEAVTPDTMAKYLTTADVDLMIRTGGECRLSNFLLWQSAYAEIYFDPALWPDYSARELDAALSWYETRERRFGRTSEQLVEARS